MTPDTLYALHERLTLDHAKAFDTAGHGAVIRVTPTDSGRAWLDDWKFYRRTYAHLRLAGQNPDALLQARFGLVLDSELPPETPHDNGRRVAHDGPDASEIRWYDDTLREDDDGPEAA